MGRIQEEKGGNIQSHELDNCFKGSCCQRAPKNEAEAEGDANK